MRFKVAWASDVSTSIWGCRVLNQVHGSMDSKGLSAWNLSSGSFLGNCARPPPLRLPSFFSWFLAVAVVVTVTSIVTLILSLRMPGLHGKTERLEATSFAHLQISSAPVKSYCLATLPLSPHPDHKATKPIFKPSTLSP